MTTERTPLQQVALVCFCGAAALVLVVLLAGLAPALYCGANASANCQSGVSIVMAALGLCALGLAMVTGFVGIVISGLVLFRQRDALLALLAILSLLFDLVVFLPGLAPSLNTKGWVLIALAGYPLIVLALSLWSLWQERRRVIASAEPERKG